MQFVFRLGPLPADDPPMTAYFVCPGRAGQETVFARTADDALARIAAAYVGEAIAVEPEFADSGARLGLRSAPITPDCARLLGLVTFDTALPGCFLKIQPEGLLHEYGMACAAFWRAAPWRWKYARQPLQVEMRAPTSSFGLDAVVMGWQGESRGLALFANLGIVQRLGIGGVRELADTVEGLSTLGVSFDSEPAFGADAMRRAYDLPRLPVPIRLVEGAREPLDAQALAQLIAVLRAIEALTDAGENSTGYVRAENFEVQAVVTPYRDSG